MGNNNVNLQTVKGQQSKAHKYIHLYCNSLYDDDE